MSVLGLICVLLALVATLLFVLFLFQRRDLRAVSELSLTVQRAVSGERLPQRIEMEPGHETQLDVQALGVSVNQLLMRAARTTGREKAGPLQAILSGTPAARDYPAGLVAPAAGELHWFADQAALGGR